MKPSFAAVIYLSGCFNITDVAFLSLQMFLRENRCILKKKLMLTRLQKKLQKFSKKKNNPKIKNPKKLQKFSKKKKNNPKIKNPNNDSIIDALKSSLNMRTTKGRRAARIIDIAAELSCLSKYNFLKARNVRLLGIGTVGTVFLSCGGNICVAVKIMEMVNKEELEEFHHEVMMQKQFHGIGPDLYNSCTLRKNGKIYGAIVMEKMFIELDSYLSYPRKKKELISIGNQLTGIIANMTDKRITHGDLALFNISVTDDGIVKLIDFDRSSVNIFMPEVDVYRIIGEMYDPSSTKNTKKMPRKNTDTLLQFSEKWLQAAGLETIDPKEAEDKWYDAYEIYCVKANIKCLT